MSDPGGFDPCECMWNHELAMRRLISLLRSSQSYCTDNECISDLPGLQGQAQNDTMPFLVFCWIVLAMALFFLRPSSATRQSDVKPSDNQGPGPQPPNPPPAVN
ncbi:small integral membrane protein 14-like [Daphnia pulex]|uniref:small integral membrane protein 14-like n=1 Tax=Daphnia pulex TaxID=6669 RepID=UPI001EDFB4C4|nr:small integral membrane protein 14-like [Daphnia pulex]XP_046643975.1 small integral membrane protein 14-like [Daphnia pulicaria]